MSFFKLKYRNILLMYFESIALPDKSDKYGIIVAIFGFLKIHKFKGVEEYF